MTFWVAGYRNVTASYGANGFTSRPQRGLRAARHRSACTSLTTATRRVTKLPVKLADELMPMGIECFRVQFPKGMDANAHARKTKPATKLFGLLLTGAAWMGKGPRPAGRVPVPVIVAALPQPIAAPPAEPMSAADEPASDEPTAKEKIIEEQTPEPVIEAAAQPGEAQAAVAEIAAEPEPQQPQQRTFSLAVNAVPLEEPAARPMPLSVPNEPKVGDRRRRSDGRRHGPARVSRAVAGKIHELGAGCKST